jgi:hypothetical protein
MKHRVIASLLLTCAATTAAHADDASSPGYLALTGAAGGTGSGLLASARIDGAYHLGVLPDASYLHVALGTSSVAREGEVFGDLPADAFYRESFGTIDAQVGAEWTPCTAGGWCGYLGADLAWSHSMKFGSSPYATAYARYGLVARVGGEAGHGTVRFRYGLDVANVWATRASQVGATLSPTGAYQLGATINLALVVRL